MGVSERFACRVTGQNRTTQRRQPAASTPADPDAALRAWLRDVREGPSTARVPPRLSRRPRRGLARESQEDPAAVARGRPAGAATAPTQTPRHHHRTGPAEADAPNRVWAVDFQFDATTDGRPIKIVSIIDEHTRECLGGLVERSITGDDLIDELDRLAAERGYPAVLRCDNGPELACAAMADWAGERVGLCLHPARRALAQRLRRVVQQPGPRRMPQHQHLLVTGPSPRRDHRLEGGLQPPPTAQFASATRRPWPSPPPVRTTGGCRVTRTYLRRAPLAGCLVACQTPHMTEGITDALAIARAEFERRLTAITDDDWAGRHRARSGMSAIWSTTSSAMSTATPTTSRRTTPGTTWPPATTTSSATIRTAPGPGAWLFSMRQ